MHVSPSVVSARLPQDLGQPLDLVHSLTKFLLALSFAAMAPTPQSVERNLRALISGDVEFDRVSRRLYATDAGLTQIEPLGVVSPRDDQDVARLVRYAADAGLSLVPRGMGSGLNGAAVGPGIQVDFCRYMDAIVELDPDAAWVRVQPGMVLSRLNSLLRPRGVFFPPDPSSENHCSIGGMIGTNASGARTVAYGATKDHVLSLDLVMADGSLYRAEPLVADDSHLDLMQKGRALADRAVAATLAELSARRDSISLHMPKTGKNSCGYRVETLLEHLPLGRYRRADVEETEETAKYRGPTTPRHGIPLQQLFVGAEGTLGVVTEATLRLTPLPAQRGIAMAYFPSVFASGEAVPGILGLGPTAVEIMDSRFLALVRSHDPRIDAMLPPGADTALLIEFEGHDSAELDQKFRALASHLKGTASLRLERASSRSDTELLWRIRKSAVPLMQRAPGRRQPLPFIEDIAVPPDRVPECIAFLQRLFDREGVQAVMVGHVGDGNLHPRPMLDPRDPEDRRVMQRIYEEVTGYVLEAGGTLSGEHGDGIVNTPRLRAMYGAETYEVFVSIKRAFDPEGTLNPGKKVGSQTDGSALHPDARYGADYATLHQSPLLCFPERGYESEIERCHGCAACKSSLGTTMCPTYKATNREHASPRAKANLLRAVISGSIEASTAYGRAAAKAVTDYCIGCGMCAVECPSAVNIPKLVLEAKSRHRRAHWPSPLEMILGHAETVARIGSAVAPMAGALMRSRPIRWLGQGILGLDRRRPLDPFVHRPFHRTAEQSLDPTRAEVQARANRVGLGSAPSPAVAYFYDLFADYYDPSLASAAIRVLRAHGVGVALPQQRSSGIPEMLYGFVDRARRTAKANVAAALPHVQGGAFLVSAEPTATFAFKRHYADYLDSPATSLVADASLDLGELLVRLRNEEGDSAPPAHPLDPSRLGLGLLDLESRRTPLRIAYHQPCHLKALQIGSPGLVLLSEIPGVEVVDLSAGCCGMAGTFGMKKRTYDLSLAVGSPLFERVAEITPDLIVSECSTCRMQLAHVTGLPVAHPVTLLVQAYRA